MNIREFEARPPERVVDGHQMTADVAYPSIDPCPIGKNRRGVWKVASYRKLPTGTREIGSRDTRRPAENRPNRHDENRWHSQIDGALWFGKRQMATRRGPSKHFEQYQTNEFPRFSDDQLLSTLVHGVFGEHVIRRSWDTNGRGQ